MAIVSAVSGPWDVAVTITDVLSVSYDPPTMLVSLYGLSRAAEAVEQAGRFAVSLLAADQGGVADWLGQDGAPLPGLLGQVPHSRRAAGAPVVIDGALAWFELRVSAVHPAATHMLFVGEVEAMSRNARWDGEPLVRWRSQYRR